MIFFKKKEIQTLIIILFFFFISRLVFFRLDMTEDKRYSLEKSSISFLRSIKKNIKIEIYFEGDLPLEFSKYRNFIEQKLKEFRNINSNIEYKFVNIKMLTPLKKKKIFRKFKRRKIYATNFFTKEKGEKKQIVLYPIAKIKSDLKEIYLKFLTLENSNQTIINKLYDSERKVESEFIKALFQANLDNKQKIGIIQKNNYPPKSKFYSIFLKLKKFYKTEFIELDSDINFNKYSLLILASPPKKLSEQEKYNLDQYLMRGGKILFFINFLNINFQNLSRGLDFVIEKDLGLSEMLFKYGVRINLDLIQDLNCVHHPIVISSDNEKVNLEWLRWPFYPLIFNFGNHLICKEINQISMRFISSMDKISIDGLKHIPLLYTSLATRRTFIPIKIDLNDLKRGFDKKNFKHGRFTIGYLIEGNFSSYYKNRLLFNNNLTFKSKSPYTKIIVISSENLILNDINPHTKEHIPLGFDFYLKHKFDQEQFIFNSINYLTDEKILLNLKNKNIKLHLVNLEKIKNHYMIIQIINLLLPLFILILFAIFWIYNYKKKYAL